MDHSGRVPRTMTLLVGALSVVVGGLVLLGWSFDIAVLKSLRPGWVSMKPNTAVAFILAGLALLSFALPPSRFSLRLIRGWALLCGLIGLAALAEYLFSWEPGLDQWLFSEQAGAVGTSHPGRLAPDTAVCFTLLAVGWLLAAGKNGKTLRFWFASILGTMVMAVALAALSSYFFGDIATIPGLWGLTTMAAHTASQLVLLGAATVLVAWPADISLWSLKGRTALGLSVWTLMVIGSLVWALHQQGFHALNEAAVAARANLDKDMAFRKWATSHGGAYVPPTERTPPNPYLKVLHRDVVTTSGVCLTLMNPAYMLREMQQYFGNDYGIRSGLVSLKPLNPANTPDAWEEKALVRFERGEKELMEMQYLGSEPYMRLMLPFLVEPDCLKCHAQQGYQLGDVRGGVSTAVSLVPFLARAREGYATWALSHSVIWLLGLVGLLFFYRREVALDKVNQQAAVALRESEERFRVAAATANDLVYEWDLHERLRWWGKIDEMLGYAAGEFPRTMQGWMEALHPEDRAQVMAAVQAHLESGAFYAVEYRIRRKDGVYQWWSGRGEVIKNADGTPVRLVGTVTDITARKGAEEALRRSEENLNRAQAVSRTGSWYLDLGNNNLEWSAETYRIFGIPQGQALTMENFVACILPEDREMVLQAWNAALRGAPYDIEHRILVGNEIKWVRGRVAINFGAGGQPVAGVGSVQDITERKQAEETLKKSEEQLLQAQKMESVGRLAGGVAHDFNNMLGVIIGYTELSLEGVAPDQPLYANLQEVRMAAKRSADLTRQLLAFARKQTIVPKVLDLNETVEGMLKMLRRLIGEDIDLVWLPSTEMWPVKMDPSQLDQVLANLCVNARDAIAGVGKVTIETHIATLDGAYCAEHAGYIPGQYAVLVVSDNGCGMDKETLGKLFEPFFTTKGLGKGTGLGLATVYGIVKQNNGFVNVYSEPGYGSTFKLYLPRYAAEGEPVPVESQAAPITGGHETILLVEDEPAILGMTRRMLESLGYLVLAFTTPSEAIRVATERVGEIRLLMTDVVMPEMNGSELRKNITALAPGIRCLFMSGYTGDVIASQGVLGEEMHFIQKPFSRQELAAKVREALDYP